MALTGQQKMNIAWADWVAGAASSPLGLLSFAIAGGASWLYYQEHYAAPIPPINPNPDPDPESDGDQIGYWHNQLCRAFADGGYTTITFNEVISVASQIRPDLAQQLQDIPEQDFQNALTLVINNEFADDHTHQEALVQGEFGVSGLDLSSFNTSVDNINSSQTDNEFENYFNELLDQILTYSISTERKTQLINSLGILKYSFYLWLAD